MYKVLEGAMLVFLVCVRYCLVGTESRSLDTMSNLTTACHEVEGWCPARSVFFKYPRRYPL